MILAGVTLLSKQGKGRKKGGTERVDRWWCVPWKKKAHVSVRRKNGFAQAAL